MKKFLVLYRSPVSSTEQMASATREQMQEGMKAWQAWAERTGSALADMGAPLSASSKITDAGTAPGNDKITGFSVVEAADIEAALALMDGHPHMGWTEGCEIEVHEQVAIPGM